MPGLHGFQAPALVAAGIADAALPRLPWPYGAAKGCGAAQASRFGRKAQRAEGTAAESLHIVSAWGSAVMVPEVHEVNFVAFDCDVLSGPDWVQAMDAMKALFTTACSAMLTEMCKLPGAWPPASELFSGPLARSASSGFGEASGVPEAGRVQQFRLGRCLGRDREDGAIPDHVQPSARGVYSCRKVKCLGGTASPL